MGNVLVWAESRGGELRKVALEAVTAARRLAGATGGGEVHVVLAGPPGIAARSTDLATHGADVIFLVEAPELATFAREALAATIVGRARAGEYRAVLLGCSAQGRNLGPRIAARLDAPIATDVLDATPAGDSLVVTHPAYANKVLLSLAIAGPLAVISVRPGAIAAVESPTSARTEAIALAAAPAAVVTVTEVKEGAKGRPDLGDAPVIVAGGRGLQAAAEFRKLEILTEAVGNAALGANRAVSGDCWRPRSDPIRQNRRQVRPHLDGSVRHSGALPHLARILASR